jgi:hypothetical protein
VAPAFLPAPLAKVCSPGVVVPSVSKPLKINGIVEPQDRTVPSVSTEGTLGNFCVDQRMPGCPEGLRNCGDNHKAIVSRKALRVKENQSSGSAVCEIATRQALAKGCGVIYGNP